MAWEAFVFALVGAGSAFVNLGVYNAVLAALRAMADEGKYPDGLWK